jgi:hypothetical protein
MIYLHETRGADLTITAAIDDHVKSARSVERGTGVKLANGTTGRWKIRPVPARC